MTRAILAALALLMAFPTLAAAQVPCVERKALIGQLEHKYGETRRVIGVQAGHVVEVYASDATGTWTIVRTAPSGIACLLASGDNFEAIEQHKGEGL